jgi:hypothetical protein
MNIGLHLHDAPADSFWNRLCFALEHGFSTVYISPTKVLPGLTPTNAARRLDDHLDEQVRCALKLSRLSCPLVGCAVDPTMPEAEGAYRAHMKLAKRIGAKYLCPEASQESILAALPRLLDWAKDEGVILAVNASQPAAVPEGLGVILNVRDASAEVSPRVCAVRLPAMETIRGSARLANVIRCADSRGLPILLRNVTEENADAVRRWIEARQTGMSA